MCKVLEVIKNDKNQGINMKEFLNYIESDEIGLFIMTIDNEERMVTSEELLKKEKEIKISLINRIKGLVIGSILEKEIEINII